MQLGALAALAMNPLRSHVVLVGIKTSLGHVLLATVLHIPRSSILSLLKLVVPVYIYTVVVFLTDLYHHLC